MLVNTLRRARSRDGLAAWAARRPAVSLRRRPNNSAADVWIMPLPGLVWRFATLPISAGLLLAAALLLVALLAPAIRAKREAALQE